MNQHPSDENLEESNADEALLEAIDAWNRNDKDAAIQHVQPLADGDEPAAVLLIAYFLSEFGNPRAVDGLPYALKAARNGAPWVVERYFPKLADNPETRADAARLISVNPLSGVKNDPLGRTLQFAKKSDGDSALAMLRAAAAGPPWPVVPDSAELKQRLSELDDAVGSTEEHRQQAREAFDKASSEIEALRQDLNTRGKTLSELIDFLTNASSQSYFDQQANQYERESTRFWLIGVGVLIVAACVAILPTLLSYLPIAGHDLEGQGEIGAHFGATLAFAAVAGVLLARARSRDRDRQKNRDFYVALGTMFAYSEQIENQDEKERFKHDMGRLVLETFLRQKSLGEDGSRSVLTDIADVARSGTEPQAQ